MNRNLKLVGLIALMFVEISHTSFAQNPIINPGFEEWAQVGVVLGPIGWQTNNAPGFEPIIQGLMPHSGNFALRTEVTIVFGVSTEGGFAGQDNIPISGNVWSLSGWYYFNGIQRDGVEVKVRIYRSTITVGSGTFTTQASTAGYTRFAFNIHVVDTSVQADRAVITVRLIPDPISGTFHLGSFALFDDLDLTPVLVAVEEKDGIEPESFTLRQNFPNPFNAATTIQFHLPTRQHAVLEIFDIMGQLIATLVDEEKPPGSYQVRWNAGRLSSSVFFYRLRAGEFAHTKQLLLVK